jgi:predicted branched-subunit amino acid permease
MFMFLLDVWAGWYIGSVIGRFLGRTLAPFVVAALVWFFSPLILAVVVFVAVKKYMDTRRRYYTYYYDPVDMSYKVVPVQRLES